MKHFNKYFRILLSISAFSIITISFTSLFLSKNLFLIDLFSHYQLQYLTILLIIAIFSLFYKKIFSFIIISIYITSIFYIYLMPFQIFPSEIQGDIFYMNTYYYNFNDEIIINEILKNSPEIIFLVEANEKLISKLSKYYGKPVIERNNKFDSFVLFSKINYSNPKINQIDGLNYITIKFDKFTLFGIHAYDPLSPNKRKKNIQLIKTIREQINTIDKADEKFIILGDFNNTYFSATFRDYFKEFFHKNIFSWSTNRPWILPIDHALSNFEIEISPTKKLSSDHNGLVISTKKKITP